MFVANTKYLFFSLVDVDVIAALYSICLNSSSASVLDQYLESASCTIHTLVRCRHIALFIFLHVPLPFPYQNYCL